MTKVTLVRQSDIRSTARIREIRDLDPADRDLLPAFDHRHQRTEHCAAAASCFFRTRKKLQRGAVRVAAHRFARHRGAGSGGAAADAIGGECGHRDTLRASFGRVAEWQTRWLQVPVSSGTWGFKSPFAHSEQFHELQALRSRTRKRS